VVVFTGAANAAIDIAAARKLGIDVFDTEPLPADHPLRSLPNAPSG
jgi:phosphoglycerate dehydrogenase-like enzyme